ncbi:MAG: DUF4349 domain-containing protein, partial [Thaumarchaeota archaeon]|nr:DUF4349 domain-containing protein [Nitrososphaerota archaeon]
MKGLKSKKVAVVILLLLAFGTGLASMNYGTINFASQIVSSDFAKGQQGIPQSSQANIPPLLPNSPPGIPQQPRGGLDPGGPPVPAPAPQQPVREVVKEVPKEVIREVPREGFKGAPLVAGSLIPLQQPIADDRMVISTASVGLNVSSVAQAVTDLRRIAESMGGFVTDSFIEPIPKGR